MAEIEVKGKKGTPRVDLTPMVDLNLLLITFFMFTTTLNKPKAMEIQMPFKDETLTKEEQNKIKEGTAITLLLSKDHRIYYYDGIGDDPTNPPELKDAYFSGSNSIRDVLIDKKKKVEQLISQGVLKPTDKTTVLIKPDETCTTDDLINILDEMTINAIPIYAVVDISPVDKEFITKTEAANPE